MISDSHRISYPDSPHLPVHASACTALRAWLLTRSTIDYYNPYSANLAGQHTYARLIELKLILSVLYLV